MSTIWATLSTTLYLLLLLELCAVLGQKGSAPHKEVEALKTFFNGLNGASCGPRPSPLAKTLSWNFQTNPCIDPVWAGITCDADKRSGQIHVAMISIKGSGIQSTLPSSIGQLSDLPYLFSLDLSSNLFCGQIPSAIGNLKNLQEIYFENNSLSGTFPSAIQQLRNLSYLVGHTNRFTGQLPLLPDSLLEVSLELNSFGGTLPNAYSSLVKLTSLNLEGSSNSRSPRISGTIPSSWVSLGALTQLNLGFQNLGGSLPSFLSSLRNLQSLKLHKNAFAFSIPDSWASLSLLRELWLFDNQLSNSIPAFVGSSLTNLTSLFLQRNMFRGTLPATISSLIRLENFGIANNLLSGSIPSSICLAFTSMRNFLAGGNMLVGPIGGWLGNWPRLVSLDLSGNRFSKSIPTAMSKLSSLQLVFLQNNRLDGSLSGELLELQNLTLFNASTNFLSGALPTRTLGPKLKYLDLSNNAFAGSLFSGFASLACPLVYLSLDSNKLTGTISPRLGSLSSLTHLSLRHNSLTGGIPPSFSAGLGVGSMPNLKLLYLSSNPSLGGEFPSQLASLSLLELFLENVGLRGSIPSHFFSSWTALQKLRLSNNSLTGPIPSTFTNMKALASLQAHSNSFTGRIPQNLAPLTNLRRLWLSSNALTGPLPTAFAPRLNFIGLGDNRLKGTLPTQLSLVKGLEYLDVSNNLLVSNPSAPLDSIFNNGTTPNLFTLDISSNNFSSSIPTALFSIQKLETVIFARNCMVGTLPSSICKATKLQNLVLNGLDAGDGCLRPIWPKGNAFGLNAMRTKKKVSGTIPSCIFRLPNLKSLHLAGNGYSGYIDPTLTNWPASLKDLSISNNKLSQTIPAALQRQVGRLEKFDASYNRFNGTLSDMQMPKTLLKAVVNRFSGPIPGALLNAKLGSGTTFNILNGNKFYCDENFGFRHSDTDLPQQDPDLKNFSCGSNPINFNLYVFASLLSTAAFVFVYFGARAQTGADKQDALEAMPRTRALLGSMRQFIYLLRVMAVLLMLMLMPLYGALTASFHSMTFSYIWTITAAYKTGTFAGWILLLLFTGTLLAAFALIIRHQALILGAENDDKFAPPSEGEETGNAETEAVADDSLDVVVAAVEEEVLWSVNAVTGVMLLRLVIIFTTNAIVVLTANIVFVALIRKLESSDRALIQLSLTLFNFTWDKIIFQVLLRNSKLYFGLPENDIDAAAKKQPLIHSLREGEAFIASLTIFSQLVAPVVASVMANPECFSSLFVKISPITFSYTIIQKSREKVGTIGLELDTGSGKVDTVNNTKSFYSYESFTTQVVFSAPFQYLFQCSSAVLASYAPVMLNKAAMKAFGVPLQVYLLRKLLNHWAKREESPLKPAYWGVLHVFVPKLFWTRKERRIIYKFKEDRLRKKDFKRYGRHLPAYIFRHKHRRELNRLRMVFNRREFYAWIINDLTMLLSFGVACPPLGVAIIISILSSIIVRRHLLAAFVAYVSVPDNIKSAANFDEIVEADANYAGDANELRQLESDAKFDAEGTPIFYARWLLLSVAAITLAFLVLDTAGDEKGTATAASFFALQMLLPLPLAALVEKLFRLGVLSFCKPASTGDTENGGRASGGQFGGSNPLFNGGSGVEMMRPSSGHQSSERRSSGSSIQPSTPRRQSLHRLRLSDHPANVPSPGSAAQRLSISVLTTVPPPPQPRLCLGTLSPVPLSLALDAQETSTAAPTDQYRGRDSWVVEPRERRSFTTRISSSSNA